MGHSNRKPDHRSGQWPLRRCFSESVGALRNPLSICASKWQPFLLAILLACCQAQEDVSSQCRSTSITQSCNQCLQKNSQCAWCTDPAFLGDFRCDVAKNFQDSCPPQYLYQDVSHVKVTENVHAGTYEPQYGKVRQIEPQQVHVLAKPGETVAFPLKYYHAETEEKDIYVLNSDTETSGVSLSYLMDCKGVHERGQLCRRVQNAETVNYNVSVSIRDCNSNTVASIGIAGVREVVALYVRPQCGCDCEKAERQEKRSSHCGEEGTFSCGVCHCDNPRKGGRRCECDLPNGVSSAQMEGQCREAPDRPLCSGHGYCACGTCVCEPPHIYSGQYCECGKVECPAYNNVPCNGHGSCHCGRCTCDHGWSGSACECSPERDACTAEDGSVCSGHGSCTCNRCKCDDGYDGERCEQGTGPQTPHGGSSGEQGTDESATDAEAATSHVPEESSSDPASDDHHPPKAEQAFDSQSTASSMNCPSFRFLAFAFSFVFLRLVM